MPLLFIGHGSPMHAIATNKFTQVLTKLGESVPKPKAILCISAHWMTKGIWVTQMKQPKTIHDFGGFPKALFEVEYPCAGSPETAELIAEIIKKPKINLDDKSWGLDHGAWSVLKHMYPKADVPVIQMSIDLKESAAFHFNLGEQLRFLREQAVLIVGSGNIVHNLRLLSWDEHAKPHPWAIEFDEWSKEKMEARDFKALVNNYWETEAGRLSVPTPDHYYPLMPILGAVDKSDELKFEFEEIQHSSIGMRTISFGL